MRLDDYTPDAICRAMGLEDFKGDSALTRRDESFRLLLTPSFDPEICVTLFWREEQAVLDCRTFSSMFWHESTAANRPQLVIEEASFQRVEFANLTARLHAIREVVEQDAKKWAVCDGMHAHLVLHTSAGLVAVDANVGGSDVLCKYVADIISTVHRLLPHGKCRNAVASAGRYANLRLALDDLADSKSATQILLLGDPDSKQELKLLTRHGVSNEPMG